MSDSPVSASREDSSQANLAVGLAAAAVVLWVIFAIIDLDNALWLLVAALGAAAAIVGWRAGQGSRPTGRALVAVVVGVLAFLVVIGWAVVDAVS